MNILDTAPDPSFARLTRLAAAHFHAPIALISWTEEGRQWVLSSLGLDADEISREVSFCSQATRSETTLVLPDAQSDPRFSGVRFYAGAPLITGSGTILGALCIIDTHARNDFGPAEVSFLEDLAAIVMDRFELLETIHSISLRKKAWGTLGTPPGMAGASRILVAEDNPVTQKVVELVLSRLGFAVDLAANGKAAVAAFQRGHYDAIVMDCEMPEMGGIEAAREIRRIEGETRGVIIVALTANTEIGERERCLNAGMDDYIAKPVRMEVLAESLDKWLVRDISSVKTKDTAAQEIRDFITQEVQTHFGYLMETLDRESIAALVASFISTTQPLMDELARAIRENDLPAALRDTHTLRGSLGTVGFNRLESYVRRLEELLRAGRPSADSLAEIVSQLQIGIELLRPYQEAPG